MSDRNYTPACAELVFISSDSLVAPSESLQSFSLVKLKHPKQDDTDLIVTFLPDERRIFEIVQFKSECGSWFMGNRILSDGKLLMTSPIDPLFLSLPYFIVASESNKFMPLDHIMMDAQYPAIDCLLTCLSHSNTSQIADVKGEDDFKVYRYSKSKTLAWLHKKVQRMSLKLARTNINTQLNDGIADVYVKSVKVDAKSNQNLPYAYGMVCEYVPLELAKELAVMLRIEDISSEEAAAIVTLPPSKKSKLGSSESEPSEDYTKTMTVTNTQQDKKTKLTQAQKKLQKVDKSGMKSISSFFTPKTKK